MTNTLMEEQMNVTENDADFWSPRNCFRHPIPEIGIAANLLDQACNALLSGRHADAEELIRKADIPVLDDYIKSIAASVSKEIHRVREVQNAPPALKDRVKQRMPPAKVELSIYVRDGWHCRFCGCPVISKSARKKLHELFPEAARWGNSNIEKHLGLSALEVSLDHLIPHSRGGDNSTSNLVTACGPCQFGRGGWTLEEVGLNNPFDRQPIIDSWDGLTRVIK